MGQSVVNVRTVAVLLPILLISISGCAAQRQQERMKSALDNWVGLSVANYAAAKGYPTEIVKVGAGKSAFRWVMTDNNGPGAIVPMSGSLFVIPAQRRSCTVVLMASTEAKNPELVDWQINSWNWEGQC